MLRYLVPWDLADTNRRSGEEKRQGMFCVVHRMKVTIDSLKVVSEEIFDIRDRIGRTPKRGFSLTVGASLDKAARM